MLRLILDRGDVAIPPESMFLLDVDPRQPAEDVLRAAWSHPRVQLWGLTGEPPALPEGMNGADAFRFAVSAPFVAYAEREGKTRWGDKTPAYIEHIDRLAAIWPDARFVAPHPRRSRRRALGDEGAVRPKQRLGGGSLVGGRDPPGPQGGGASPRPRARDPLRGSRLRAERRRSRPCATSSTSNMRRTCSRSSRPTARRSSRDQAAWFTNVWAGITTAAVGKWRTELTPRQVEVFESVAGDELRALGYETSGGASSQALVPAYAAHDAAMRGVNFVRLRLVQERGREVRHVLRRKLAR